MDFGQAIRILRQKHGMTQAQLAAAVGISANAVSSLETGKVYPPKRGTLERMCRVLQVPQSYLMLASIEEGDIPEEKRILYRTVLEPFRNELLDLERK